MSWPEEGGRGALAMPLLPGSLERGGGHVFFTMLLLQDPGRGGIGHAYYLALEGGLWPCLYYLAGEGGTFAVPLLLVSVISGGGPLAQEGGGVYGSRIMLPGIKALGDL